jgi:serine O-acetyltransferase
MPQPVAKSLRSLRRRSLSGRMFSSRRFWLLSMSLNKKGHTVLARGVRNLNSILYHNSLPIEASVNPDVSFGHHGFGTVIHQKTTIGRGVKINHNVTIAVRPSTGAPHGVVIEDNVYIGANAVIITSRKHGIRIGRGARIGAGAVVTHDVDAGATMVGNPAYALPRRDDDSAPHDGALADSAQADSAPAD